MSVIGHFGIRALSGQSKPSPAIGQALGPLGINMMNFLKEFNARTAKVRPNVLLQTTLLPRSDRTYKFSIRTPEAQWFIKRAARIHTGSGSPRSNSVSYITIKELYHIAQMKCMDPELLGLPLYSVVKSLIGTAESMGVRVTLDPHPDFAKRDVVLPGDLESLRKDHKLRNKQSRRGGGKK